MLRIASAPSLAALAILLAGLGGCSGTDTKDGSASAPPASSAGADTSAPSGQNNTDEMEAARRAYLE
jgi:hypothetical protein